MEVGVWEWTEWSMIIFIRKWRGGYSEFNSRMIRAPEDVMVHNYEIARDDVALMCNVLWNAFRVDESDRESEAMGDQGS